MRLKNGMIFSEGTQFAGSVHPGDVGCGLAETVDYYANTAYHDMLGAWPELFDASADREHTFWTSDAGEDCIESMFRTLDELAPDDYYFGAHPGDGADFGWWSGIDDSEED